MSPLIGNVFSVVRNLFGAKKPPPGKMQGFPNMWKSTLGVLMATAKKPDVPPAKKDYVPPAVSELLPIRGGLGAFFSFLNKVLGNKKA